MQQRRAREMDVSGCVRKTVNKDVQALPSIQVYIDSRGQVWHDLDYVFQFLAPLQVAKRKNNFYRDCANYWRRAQMPDAHRFLRTAEMRLTSAANCCSTYALYIIVLGAIAIGRISEDSSNALLSILGHICARVAEVINRCPCTNAGQSPFIGFPNLRMGIEGRSVAGVWTTIQALPQQSQACLKNAWRRVHHANKVAYASVEEDWLLLRDLVMFLALCGRSAYSPRKMPPEAEAFVIRLSSAILWWLAQLFDVYLKEVYLVAYGSDESPPAATRRRNSETRRYVMMHPEAVWDVIQEARRSGASLSTVLSIRQKDTHAGVAKTNAPTYQSKHHIMYNTRRDLAFRDARHICVISDPSIHSKKDLGVSVIWAPTGPYRGPYRSPEALAATQGGPEALAATQGGLGPGDWGRGPGPRARGLGPGAWSPGPGPGARGSGPGAWGPRLGRRGLLRSVTYKTSCSRNSCCRRTGTYPATWW